MKKIIGLLIITVSFSSAVCESNDNYKSSVKACENKEGRGCISVSNCLMQKSYNAKTSRDRRRYDRAADKYIKKACKICRIRNFKDCPECEAVCEMYDL